MTVDAWAMAAECARAVETSENPTRRALLATLQRLWIELGEKERLLSEQEVLKEMEDLHALHVQVLGTQSSAPHARHATGLPQRCIPMPSNETPVRCPRSRIFKAGLIRFYRGVTGLHSALGF